MTGTGVGAALVALATGVIGVTFWPLSLAVFSASVIGGMFVGSVVADRLSGPALLPGFTHEVDRALVKAGIDADNPACSELVHAIGRARNGLTMALRELRIRASSPGWDAVTDVIRDFNDLLVNGVGVEEELAGDVVRAVVREAVTDLAAHPEHADLTRDASIFAGANNALRAARLTGIDGIPAAPALDQQNDNVTVAWEGGRVYTRFPWNRQVAPVLDEFFKALELAERLPGDHRQVEAIAVAMRTAEGRLRLALPLATKGRAGAIVDEAARSRLPSRGSTYLDEQAAEAVAWKFDQARALSRVRPVPGAFTGQGMSPATASHSEPMPYDASLRVGGL